MICWFWVWEIWYGILICKMWFFKFLLEEYIFKKLWKCIGIYVVEVLVFSMLFFEGIENFDKNGSISRFFMERFWLFILFFLFFFRLFVVEEVLFVVDIGGFYDNGIKFCKKIWINSWK